MRRVLVVLTLCMAALVAAAPVAADTGPLDPGVSHFRSSGNSASASFSNVPWDAETIPPGSYFYTDVWASNYIINANGEVFEDNGVCVFHEEFTIDGNGDWTSQVGFGDCTSGADLSVSRRLTGASAVANVPVGYCAAYDPNNEECLDFVDLGTVMIDLTWSGFGPIERYHGTGSGGSAGNYQYTYHGTGSGRAATASGTIDLVALDGSVQDLTGGLTGNGSLSRSRDGYTEVIVGH